ncbi:MAG TPA: hemerythrin domain-containing protein [Acidimicrobiia bacterium]|nr:hemerythrin domain-containing protein [Acidimicrobiia bacterium]
MDAIMLLKKDHKTVEELFKRFEKTGPRAYKGKQEIVERIVKELAVHAAIEEAVLYPAIRQAIDDKKIDDLVLESLEEHHIVKWTLSELDGMDPEHERYDAKVTVLMESVRHHVEEEEQELFPKVAKAFGKPRLEELGEALEAAKKTAPTRPHPRLPDEPPGNILGAPGAAMMDKARDAGRKVVRQAVGSARR